MQQNKFDILGVSECPWTRSGRSKLQSGHTIIYSGHNTNHVSGVAIIMSKNAVKTLLEWEAISDRLIRARFNSQYCKITIIQCYAPRNDDEEDTKCEFYEQLQTTISNVPRHDVTVVMGDMNAKVGSDNTNIESAMGKHGSGY